ncbi:hypothetical protein [Limosilactobacillus allomucosae]|uniref:Membrane protein 6-pyruvoyl-tetrahydropterin synthase-related domain-containing protein n=1 Tax=Limosilactobacillus allomucosae TaxID=3142938 RepID=A0AAU7C1R3_9LACO
MGSSLKRKIITGIVFFLFIMLWLFWLWKQLMIGTFVTGDSFFHASRIYEIRYAFLHHELPNFLNFQSFFGMGQAVNGMYPDISLWPLVLITLPLSFIKQIYAIRLMIIFLTLLVTYVSLVGRRVSKINSLLASIIYVTSGYSLYQSVVELQPGTAIIYCFSFPIFFCAEEIIESKSVDRLLILKTALLLAIILYSHLLSVISLIIIISLVLLYNFFINGNDIKYSIINSMLASAVSFLFALPILFRYFIISKSDISAPFSQGNITSESLIELFQMPYGWAARTTLPAISLFLIFLTIFLRSNNKKILNYLSIESLLMLLCTNLFPWAIFNKVPIVNNLQFTPWRFGIWLGIIPLIAFLKNFNNQKILWKLLIVFASLSVFACLQFITDFYSNNQQVLTLQLYKNKQGKNQVAGDDLDKVILTRDYTPKRSNIKGNDNRVTHLTSSLAFSPHVFTKEAQAKITKESFNNGIKMTIDDPIEGKISLPMYCYRSINYRVKINGEGIPYTTDKKGYLQLTSDLNLKKNDVITITVKNPKIYMYLVFLSLGLYVIGLIYFFISKVRIL